MIRSELCAIAGLNRETFNTHRRNGDLPFDPLPRVGEESAWGRFTLLDATLLIAARRLVAWQGLQWHRAAEMLRQPFMDVPGPGTERNYFDGPGVFRVQVDFRREDGSEPENHILTATRYCQGPLAEIAAWATKAAAMATHRHFEAGYLNAGAVVVAGFTAVDLSAAFKCALLEAERHGVDLSGELPEASSTAHTPEAEGGAA